MDGDRIKDDLDLQRPRSVGREVVVSPGDLVGVPGGLVEICIGAGSFGSIEQKFMPALFFNGPHGLHREGENGILSRNAIRRGL